MAAFVTGPFSLFGVQSSTVDAISRKLRFVSPSARLFRNLVSFGPPVPFLQRCAEGSHYLAGLKLPVVLFRLVQYGQAGIFKPHFLFTISKLFQITFRLIKGSRGLHWLQQKKFTGKDKIPYVLAPLIAIIMGIKLYRLVSKIVKGRNGSNNAQARYEVLAHQFKLAAFLTDAIGFAVFTHHLKRQNLGRVFQAAAAVMTICSHVYKEKSL